MPGTTPEFRGQKVGQAPDVLNQKDKDDHTRLRAEKFQKQASKSNAVRREDIVDELPDYIDTISKIADENIFEPHFRSNAGIFERNLSDNMTDLRSVRKIDQLLRHTKVFAALGSIFLMSLSLRSGMRASTRAPLPMRRPAAPSG